MHAPCDKARLACTEGGETHILAVLAQVRAGDAKLSFSPEQQLEARLEAG